MKPYGVPRVPELNYPDVGDIQKFGLNKSAGGKDYFKNKAKKKAARRYFKRRARRSAIEMD